MLQSFIYWICHGKLESFNYKKENAKHIMILYELSLFFNADDLTKDIMIEIEGNFMLPDCIIEIWLHAIQLCLSNLQNICWAMFIDRFNELPQEFIDKLTYKTLMKLTFNSNLRCDSCQLKRIVEKYNENNSVRIHQWILRDIIMMLY